MRSPSSQQNALLCYTPSLASKYGQLVLFDSHARYRRNHHPYRVQFPDLPYTYTSLLDGADRRRYRTSVPDA